MSCRLRTKINSLVSDWEASGLPGRTTLHEIADDLLAWRSDHNVAGLWQTPPCMMGATLDDAWGLGIELILKYAGVLGMETRYLGVLLTWQELVAACRSFRPDYLGLTLLQLDSEDDVIALRKQLPAEVKIIAGGPVFKLDADLQERAGIDVVAKDLTVFLRFLLEPALSC